jgi:hypothetical protein
MPCVVVPAGASAPSPVLVTRPPIFLVVVGFLVFVLVLLLGAGFVRGVARGRFLVLVLLLVVVVVVVAGRGFGGDGPVRSVLIFAGVVVEVVALVAAERDEVILRIFRLLGVRALRRQLCRACLLFPGESHGDWDVGLGLGIHRRPPGGVAVRRGGLRAVSVAILIRARRCVGEIDHRRGPPGGLHRGALLLAEELEVLLGVPVDELEPRGVPARDVHALHALEQFTVLERRLKLDRRRRVRSFALRLRSYRDAGYRAGGGEHRAYRLLRTKGKGVKDVNGGSTDVGSRHGMKGGGVGIG